MIGPWTRNETSASGQVFEFRLWAALTEQSRGLLHVFLPLSDRGVDALVHRLTDGAYLEVQAKSRSTLMDGEVHLVILGESLANDEVMIVAGQLVDGGLGPTVLAIPAGDFKGLADLTTDQGKPIYSMEFGMRPRSDSRWLPWLVPADRIAWRSDVGFLGEAEVTRRLAESGDLNLFRPFPDSETAEIAVLHRDSRHVVALQVKTVDVTQARLHATVDVYASSFRASPTTHIVVLAWLRDEELFHQECLLIPSTELLDIASNDRAGHLGFVFDPGSAAQRQLDPYRRRLPELHREVERLL